MRAFILTSLITLAAAPALAAPPEVQVKIGPKLHDQAVRELGLREVDGLAADLRRQVERELGRTGVLEGARLELTLVDAKPNRPTFKQLGDKPGLSYESFGVGGATIEGRAIAVDGSVTPIRYRWYETDIRNAPYRMTWS
ncbi:MAG TPA: hypothetical protein VFW47_17330, partial [Phenylobacterium sp.]|nr:hypothetical protein [Phenylobacterium sp.]